MRKLLLPIAALAALFLAPLCAQAQTYSRGQTGAVGSIVSCTTPDGSTVKCVVSAAVGNVAAGATDSGNPVKVAGVFNSTLPTLTTGQRGDLQLGSRGSLNVSIYDPQNATGNNAVGVISAADAMNNASQALIVLSRSSVFNGSTWDRQFTCGNSAIVSVTAGATTQIVALSGTTVVRVCSIALTMSAAGTAKFVTGTGSNCGTGTTDLTAAFTLATGTPLTISGGGGNSVFRTAAGGALCVSAVTGNATGVVSYSQY